MNFKFTKSTIIEIRVLIVSILFLAAFTSSTPSVVLGQGFGGGGGAGGGGSGAVGGSGVQSSPPGVGSGTGGASGCTTIPVGSGGELEPCFDIQPDGTVNCPKCESCPSENATSGADMPGGGNSGGSNGGSNCNNCGSSGKSGGTSVGENFVARGVTRFWYPFNRVSNSSFSPGFYSQFDSQISLFPGTGGNTIAFFDVLVGRVYLLKDGLDGDALDGTYKDLKNNHVKQLVLFTSSGTVTSTLSSAVRAVVTHYNGSTEEFGLFDLAGQQSGRLTKRVSLDGRELNVSYPTLTQMQITQSPAAQWKIQSVSDSLGNVLSFTYGTAQVGGMWPVSRVDRNDGQFVSYTYANNALATISNNAGQTGSITYGQDPVAQTATATMTDIAITRGRQLTYHLTNDYMTLTSSGQTQVINQPTGVHRMRVNGANEEEWLLIPNSDPSNASKFIYKGGNAAIVSYGNGRNQAYDSWSYSSELPPMSVGFNGITGTLNPQITGSLATITTAQLYNGQTPGIVDAANIQKNFAYDVSGRATQVTYVADGTYIAASYNSASQITRYRDRGASVTKFEYDAQGHLLTKKVGMIEQAGSDVATAEYAEYTYEYYPTTHVNKGLLKAEMSPLYNAGSPTVYRTDYEYDTAGRKTKVTQSADVAGGARAVTQFAYDATGNLLQVTDPMNRVTAYAYDSKGRRISTTYPDSSTEQILYGALGTSQAGLVLRTKDRANVVTANTYDSAGRITQVVTGSAIDSNILDGQADTNPISDPNLKNVVNYSYLGGSSLQTQTKVNGATTDFVYDIQNRMIESKVYPRVGVTLSSKKSYSNNQLFYDEDPFGRRKYYGYRASDGTLIRTITCTVPEQTFASFTAVWNQTRDLAPNAKYIIHDGIRDAEGHLTQVIDGRGTETRYEYDSQGREINKREAFGTTIEARTQTIYDIAGNVTEVRSPRYFDASDANGYNKCRDTFTYNGRGVRASHTEAQGTPEAATESFTYDLLGKQLTHTDFGGNVWTTIDNACCGKQIGSQDPLGHGNIRNSDSLGRSIHSIVVSDIATHSDFSNPLDAKTLGESTTKFDSLGRVVASTTWLAARGVVDPNNPPIAGLGSDPVLQGLTTFYLYDTNLSDGVGLDSASGLSVVKQSGANPTGSFSVSLANAIAKLADTQANGGAGIAFNALSPAKASVTVNSEDEISFSISDAAGRSVMSGKLDNYKGTQNALVTWSTQVHDGTYNLATYGTLLESKSIDALGNATRQRTDATGRTIQSLNQLDAVTIFTYDAGGNQLSFRDPNNVGLDIVYDAQGRSTSRTDTVGDADSSTFDRTGNAIKQTDAKNKFTTIIFDARGRRKSITDRLGGVTAFSYTALGQLLSLTDAENQSTYYAYDARGSKITEQYPDHTVGTSPGNVGYGIVNLFYDNAGRALRKQDQQGDTVTFNYDLAGRVVSRDYRTLINSPVGSIADSDVYSFDRVGRIVSATSGRYGNTVAFTWNSVGRKASESLSIASQAYTTGITYNARGELIKYIYPDGSIVERLYHPSGSLNQVKLDGTALDTRGYDAGGRLASSTYSNGIATTWSYRSDNLISSINTTSPAGTPADQFVGNLAYSWDANKNKLSETVSNVPAPVAGYGFNSVDSNYDFDDRLTQWKRSNGTLNQSWILTPVGDWSSHTVNGTTTSRTHGKTHKLQSIGANPLSYDAKGNVNQDTSLSPTQNYSWDFDNKLKSADIDGNNSVDVTFEYDALGRRVSRTQGTDSVVFYQVGQQTVADYPRGGATATPRFRYFWAAYVDELIARKSTGTGGLLLFGHHNQQFSLYAFSNNNGEVVERIGYTANGQPTFMSASGTVQSTSSNAFRHSFTAREWDATLQLYHYRARWMSGVGGRFLSRDPIGYKSSINFYSYVDNRPTISMDPSGEVCALNIPGEQGFVAKRTGNIAESTYLAGIAIYTAWYTKHLVLSSDVKSASLAVRAAASFQRQTGAVFSTTGFSVPAKANGTVSCKEIVPCECQIEVSASGKQGPRSVKSSGTFKDHVTLDAFAAVTTSNPSAGDSSASLKWSGGAGYGGSFETVLESPVEKFKFKYVDDENRKDQVENGQEPNFSCKYYRENSPEYITLKREAALYNLVATLDKYRFDHLQTDTVPDIPVFP